LIQEAWLWISTASPDLEIEGYKTLAYRAMWSEYRQGKKGRYTPQELQALHEAKIYRLSNALAHGYGSLF